MKNTISLSRLALPHAAWNFSDRPFSSIEALCGSLKRRVRNKIQLCFAFWNYALWISDMETLQKAEWLSLNIHFSKNPWSLLHSRESMVGPFTFLDVCLFYIYIFNSVCPSCSCSAVSDAFASSCLLLPAGLLRPHLSACVIQHSVWHTYITLQLEVSVGVSKNTYLPDSPTTLPSPSQSLLLRSTCAVDQQPERVRDI